MSKPQTSAQVIARAAQKQRGSRSTRANLNREGQALNQWLSAQGHPDVRPRHLTLLQVKAYLVFRANPVAASEGQRERPGCSVAAQANLLSKIRSLIRNDHGDPDAAGITRKQLGIAPRSRVGKKLPIEQNHFEQVVAEARSKGQEGLALTLELERYLGFRGLEALSSTSALLEFACDAVRLLGQSNSTAAGGPGLRDLCMAVVDGTKGGRIRDTFVLQRHALTTLHVIQQALDYAATHDGFLVVGKKNDLASARRHYHSQCRKLGLVGQFSPHSLRYRYAVDLLQELMERGWSRQDSLARVSLALGHGSSRQRYVRSVYCNSVVDQLPPPEKRTRTMQRQAAELRELMAQWRTKREATAGTLEPLDDQPDAAAELMA